MMGVGFLWVISLLGLIREFIAQGTLFSGIEMLIPGTEGIRVLGDDYPGFLIALLPPGAFFVLGAMIAARNWWEARTARLQLNASAPAMNARSQ